MGESACSCASFNKYKPKAVASVNEEITICFASGTSKRAELFVNKLLDLRADIEVQAHEDELKSLAASVSHRSRS